MKDQNIKSLLYKILTILNGIKFQNLILLLKLKQLNSKI